MNIVDTIYELDAAYKNAETALREFAGKIENLKAEYKDIVLFTIIKCVANEYAYHTDIILSKTKLDRATEARCMIAVVAKVFNINNQFVKDRLNLTTGRYNWLIRLYNDLYIEDENFQNTMNSIIKQIKSL